MDPVEKAIAFFFLITTMLSIGLKVLPEELLSIVRGPSLMARSLAVNFIVIPILGFVLVKAIPMSQDVAVALLLLAAAPGGLNAIQFTSKAPSDVAYAASLLFILSVLAVAVSPAIAGLMLQGDTPLTLPYARIIAILLACVLLPLAAGLGVARMWQRTADILARPLAWCGTIAFVIVVVLLLSQRRQAIGALDGAELAAMLGLIFATMAIGWLLGGPRKATRTILATASSMRNAALVLMIAINSFPNTNVDVAVIAFSGLMIPPNMLFTVYEAIQARRVSRRATAGREAR